MMSKPYHPCAVAACERRATVMCLCMGHYQRWRRHGTPGDTALEEHKPSHGTTNMYRRHGCRCEACHKANTDYNRDLKRKHRLRGTSMAQPLAETPTNPSDQEASQKQDGKHPETGR